MNVDPAITVNQGVIDRASNRIIVNLRVVRTGTDPVREGRIKATRDTRLWGKVRILICPVGFRFRSPSSSCKSHYYEMR